MRQKIIAGIAFTAFLVVELAGIQVADAQRLRNMLRRNNNDCPNCCENCGIASESMGAVAQGVTIESPIVSEGSTTTPYAGEIYSSPSQATAYEQPSVESFPTTYVESAPLTQTMESPMYSTPSINVYAAEGTMEAMPTSYEGTGEIVSGGCTNCGNAGQYIQGQAMPVSYEGTGEIVGGGCTNCGNAGAVAWGGNESQYIQGQAIPVSYEGTGEIVSGGCTNCGNVGTVSWGGEGQYIEGQPMPMTTEMSYGGQGVVIDGGMVGGGQVLGCATGDCGNIVNGGEIMVEGQSNGIQTGETIISSEVVSETPMETTTGETTTDSPVTTEETKTDDAPKDTVPEAPAASGDDKEA